MSISSDDDTDTTEQSDSQFDSKLDPDVHMRMEDDVDAPDGVDFDGDVDMERDSYDKVKEHESKEDEEEEEDEDEGEGKEPRTTGQEAMVNSSAEFVDTVVDDQPIMLPAQGQEMRKHTPRPQPLAPTPGPQTPDPRPRPQTPETHLLSGLQHLGLLTTQKPRPAVPTLREPEAAGNTSAVDVDQQLLIESAVRDSISDVPHPAVPLTEVHPDGSEVKE